MKRILVAGFSACVAASVAAVLGAVLDPGPLWAASPQVERAIEAIEAVSGDAGKLKLFCELNALLQEAGGKEDPDTLKQVDDLIAKIGADFSAAWDVGDELDENSPDGQEFYAAVDTLADKCPQ